MTSLRSPAALLVSGSLALGALAAFILFAALSLPSFGLRLDVAGQAALATGLDRAAPLDARLLPMRIERVSGPAATIAIEGADLFLDQAEWTPARMRRALARQGAIARVVAAGPVTLHLRDRAGRAHAVPLRAVRRGAGDLPPDGWVPLVTGLVAGIVGLWVLALRPHHWGGRMLALSGLGVVLAGYSTAFYAARELTMGGAAAWVIGINHVGTQMFGVAIIALLGRYPSPLLPHAVLISVTAASAAMLALDVAQVTSFYAMLLLMVADFVAIVALYAWQWSATRHDAEARAGLRLIGLSVLLCAAGYVAIFLAPMMLGLPALNLSYGFALLILIYLGLAAGIGRFRLFDLDRWAYRLLAAALGALVLLALDGMLLVGLGLARVPALGLSILLAGFLYLPLRDRLWRSLVEPRRPDEHALFAAASEVALAATARDRALRWTALLEQLFAPLERVLAADPLAGAALSSDRRALTVPPIADVPAMLLRHPWRGRGLFGAAHCRLVRDLAAHVTQVEAARHAYDRGVTEERGRIARDLHDDVSARLLTSLHRDDAGQIRQDVREAMADIRTIVGGLSGQCRPLDQMLADMRHETDQRLAAAGVALDWPPPDVAEPVPLLDYASYRNFTSAEREVVSNILRHADAARVTVRMTRDADALTLTIADDGVGCVAARAGDVGNGLRNIGRRLAEIGGTVALTSAGHGTEVRLTLPLATPSAAPAADPRISGAGEAAAPA